MTRPACIIATEAHNQFFKDLTWRTWFRLHCPVVVGYTPSFDSVDQGMQVPSWHPCALAYWDAYAIYDSVLKPSPKGAAGTHSFYSATDSQWILKDATGNKLKIDWQDADGTYRQYAADITDPQFVGASIGRAEDILALGYHGIYWDDVNLAPRFVTEAGVPSQVIDVDLWKQAMLDYMQQVHEAFSGHVIVHNTPWWDIDDEQFRLADYVNVERGFGDPNLKLADGIKIAKMIERAHKAGCKVIVEEYSKANLPTSLPCYDAVCRDGDLVAVEDMMPPEWGI